MKVGTITMSSAYSVVTCHCYTCMLSNKRRMLDPDGKHLIGTNRGLKLCQNTLDLLILATHRHVAPFDTKPSNYTHIPHVD